MLSKMGADAGTGDRWGFLVRPLTCIKVSLTQPLRQRPFMDAEVLRDLSDRHLVITLLSHPDNVLFELLGIRLGHDNYPSRPVISEPDQLSPIPASAPSNASGGDLLGSSI